MPPWKLKDEPGGETVHCYQWPDIRKAECDARAVQQFGATEIPEVEGGIQTLEPLPRINQAMMTKPHNLEP